MGLFDNAVSALESGMGHVGSAVDAAANLAGNAAIENTAFMRGFATCCKEGFDQGWHEANGGNLSYRLTAEEATSLSGRIAACKSGWIELAEPCAELGEALFAVTAAGKHLRNVPKDLAANAGIVELSKDGSAYRCVWGFENGARPTSELASHILIHAARAKKTAGLSRVLYHVHPANIVALTMLVPATSKDITQALWRSMTECIIVFPKGIGALPWMVPGGVEIARATGAVMEDYPAVIWAHHGMFVSAADFDTAFGMVHAADKAAGVYLKARAANGGAASFASTISDDNLLQISRELGIDINESLLG